MGNCMTKMDDKMYDKNGNCMTKIEIHGQLYDKNEHSSVRTNRHTDNYTVKRGDGHTDRRTQ